MDESGNETTSERTNDMEDIINGEGFEAAIADTLKGREAKAPAKVPADLEEAWAELSTEEQAAYRRSAEIWWPPEEPKKLEHETRATHALRVEQAEADRQVLLDRDQVKAFRQARTPPKLQGIVDAMGAGSKERNAARVKAAEVQAQEDKRVRDNQRKIAGREGGSGLGGWRQV